MASQQYSAVSKMLHWVMGLVIFGLLILGFYMVSLDASPFKLSLYGWHKSFGILILGFVAFRFIWRFAVKPPPALASHAIWEELLSKIIKIALYAGMVGMPVSGWLMSSAGGFPATFFGLFALPDVTGKDQDLFKLMRDVHLIFSYMLIGSIGLHVAGALKHHFIDRDETLQRMTSAGVGVKAGVIIAFGAAALLAMPSFLAFQPYLAKIKTEIQEVVEIPAVRAVPVDVVQTQSHTWVIDYDKSTIMFEATQYGSAFTGEFADFEGEIVFDPDDMSNNMADIVIDIPSMKTGSADRDSQALGQDWFYVQNFPKAHFKTTSFEKRDANRYVAKADLTIRGIKIPVELPFSLKIEEKNDGKRTAYMEGDLTIQRLDFGIGQGEWKSAEAIGNPVKIKIAVQATQPDF